MLLELLPDAGLAGLRRIEQAGRSLKVAWIGRRGQVDVAGLLRPGREAACTDREAEDVQEAPGAESETMKCLEPLSSRHSSILPAGNYLYAR